MMSLALLSRAGTATPDLSQAVYVWQRSWNGAVLDAVRDRVTNFSMTILLAAEVSWQSGRPGIIRVPINWESLNRPGSSVGLALRIGPYSGPFDSDDGGAQRLASLARSLVTEAAEHGVQARELQIDFDCAESKLEGYLAWVIAIQRAVSPTPVVITALPVWLKHAAFERLARAADGYVLQVHSLERPQHPNAPFTLCDPRAARKAVAQAGRLGLPFRVALPTYGYLIAFDAEGNFAGLSAEGPPRSWKPGTRLREVRSDPTAIAALVRDWSRTHPESMQGITWYRLPVEGEVLNWSWPTLATVMRGETPEPRLRAEARRPQPGLVEFDLVNDGDAEFAGGPELLATWSGSRPLASDGLRGFEPSVAGSNAIRFRSTRPAVRIRPLERQMIGWLRLAGDAPVNVELCHSSNDPSQ